MSDIARGKLLLIPGFARRSGRRLAVPLVLCLLIGITGFASQDAAAQSWRFEPATLRGKPVRVIYNLTVNFRLQ